MTSRSRTALLPTIPERIAELARRHVPTRLAREDLDRPPDPAIRVSGELPARRLTLVEGGQDVSQCIILDFEQQVGSAALRMAGVAGVATPPEHRFKGHCRRLMEGMLRWMRREGYAVSLLYGIRGFYPRFGYAEAFPDVTWTMAVRDAERAAGPGYAFVPFDPDRHRRAALRMYHANHAGRTGFIRRSERTWPAFSRALNPASRFPAKVALDEGGRPAGYIVYDTVNETTVVEAGFTTRRVFPALLRDAFEQAWSRRFETIRFILDEQDALMRYARPFGLAQEVRTRADGGAMVRMISVPAALRALAPVLAGRVSGRGRLAIRTNLDSAGLAWRDGRLQVEPARPGVRAVSLPQWALAQLVYGYAGADELYEARILRGSAAARDHLAALFPPGPHFCCRTDRF